VNQKSLGSDPEHSPESEREARVTHLVAFPLMLRSQSSVQSFLKGCRKGIGHHQMRQLVNFVSPWLGYGAQAFGQTPIWMLL